MSIAKQPVQAGVPINTRLPDPPLPTKMIGQFMVEYQKWAMQMIEVLNRRNEALQKQIDELK